MTSEHPTISAFLAKCQETFAGWQVDTREAAETANVGHPGIRVSDKELETLGTDYLDTYLGMVADDLSGLTREQGFAYPEAPRGVVERENGQTAFYVAASVVKTFADPETQASYELDQEATWERTCAFYSGLNEILRPDRLELE